MILPAAWIERWKGQDIFGKLFALEGKVYRAQEGRKTLRFLLDGKYYFAKLHKGVGWKQIINDLLQLRLPVIGAQNEWRAIQRLEKSGINTMELVGYGKKGWNPARFESFVITEELKNTISLEDYCRDWAVSPPSHALKSALITEVAKIARTIHEDGMNHRDLYICHFLLDISGGSEKIDPHRFCLYLIDLHRMQIRSHIPWRWRVKDIAALYFSSMDIGLSRCDLLRFMMAYRNKPLKESIGKNRLFWWQVRRKGRVLYRKFHSKDIKGSGR